MGKDSFGIQLPQFGQNLKENPRLTRERRSFPIIAKFKGFAVDP